MAGRSPEEGHPIDDSAPALAGDVMASTTEEATSCPPAAPSNPDLTVTAFEKGSRDTTPKAKRWPFEALVGWLRNPRRAKPKPPAWWTRKNSDASPEEVEKARKLAHPMFAGYRVREGGRRRTEDLEAFTLLILDVDNKCDPDDVLTIEQARAELEERQVRAVLYPSWSHAEERPRFRVVLPLASEIPADAYRRWYPEALRSLGWLDHPALDQVVDNPAQAYLVPLQRKGAPPPEVLDLDGAPLDVPVPPEPPPPPRKPRRSIAPLLGATDGKVPDQVLEEIRNRVDLVALAERLGIELKREGKNWVACCPLPGHEEKTPSFKIQDGARFFKCFGCNRGGDCFTLVREVEGLDFPAALRYVAGEAGVSLPERPQRKRPARRRRSKKTTQRLAPDRDTPPTDLQRAVRLLDEHRLTDIGNGEWIAEEHRETLRFCHAMRSWLCWDGRRWELDRAAGAVRRAKDTVLGMVRAAEVLGEVELEDRDHDATKARVKKVLAWVEKSQAAKSVRNALEMAETEEGIPVHPDELDGDHWLLNVENGTLDLRTGRLRPHRRGDLLTKLAPVPYDPEASCPRWLDFVRWAMEGRPDLIDYLRRAVGYALTGSTREQCFFFLHGSGANGKSTFVGIVQDLLGADYSQTMRSEVLLPKRMDSTAATPEVARLKGVRFVSSVETEEERKLAEALIKQLTGGDKITARYLNQNPIEFWPTHKIFMAGNHKPEIRGTDQAIWRRVHLVPFDAHLDEDEKDHELPAKLRQELPGILAWAVRGCLEWQQHGLAPPAEVRAATDAYRQEMDVLGDFLEERCETHPRFTVQARRLYQEYRDWCQEVGRLPYSETKFGRRLTSRGFQKEHSRTGKRYVGLGLIAEPSP